MNEFFFIAFTLLLLSGVTGVLKFRPDLAAPLTVTLMVIISQLSGAELTAFGLTSNVGCILYGVVIFCLAMVTHRDGQAAAGCIIERVLFALGLMQLLFVGYRLNPVPLSPELATVTAASARVVAASFVAFVISTGVVIKLSSVWSKWWGIGGACMAAQVVDTFLFFPCAFAGTGVDVVGYMASGMVFKLFVTALCWPFAEILMAGKPRNETPPPNDCP